MAKITLYEHAHQQGEHLVLTGTDANLHNNDFPGLLTGDWGDRVSSVDVESGTWRLYQHDGHHGPSVEFGPGLHELESFENDQISSVLLL